MKLKILIAPLLIVLIIYFAIWWVMPTYFDYQTKTDELKKAQTVLAEAQKKNQLVSQMTESLQADSGQRDTLFSYIPESKQEEKIIGNLNAITSASGLAVFDMQVSKVEKGADAQKSDSAASAGASGSNASIQSKNSNAAVVNTFQVSIGAVGSYNSIRLFIGQIAKLQRYNNINSLKIARAKTSNSDNNDSDSTDQQPAVSDILQTYIEFTFNYLDKDSVAVNGNEALFKDGSFDMSVIDDIRNKMTTTMSELNPAIEGKINPFMP